MNRIPQGPEGSLSSYLDRIVANNNTLRTENAELKRQLQTVTKVAKEALEELADMIGYVPDYFRSKWGYDETVANLATELSSITGEPTAMQCECNDDEHQLPCKNPVPERWTDDGIRRIHSSPELCEPCLYGCMP
jgi:hypothetical protein